MSKVIYSMSVSLDGFMEDPDRSLDWVIIDEEIHRFFNDQARETGTFLYGRRMYELMTAYWPTADGAPSAPDYEVDYARIWKEKPKVVFSKTLEKVEWNSRLVKDNLAEEIKQLKDQPENDMQVGGPNLASSLIGLGLIDEYHLFVHPVVLGGGTPFFPALDTAMSFWLLETRTFGSGVVYLRYERR
jgi:dihydrofolate reductase